MRVAFVNQDRGIAPDRKKGAAVHLRAMRRAFEDLGAEVEAFDESDSAQLRQRLERAWDSSPFQLVYERYALGSTEGQRFAEKKGIPLVLEVNAPLAEEERRYRGALGEDEFAARERDVFRYSTCVVCVSSEVAEYAVSRGASRDHVRVFPNGVDTKRFRPRATDDPLRRELVPEGRLVLGFHGRLRPWHGFERLARTAAELLEREVPVHLVLVGEGDFEPALRGLVPEDRFTRVGWVDHDRIAPYVATFDLLPLTYAPDVPCYFSPLKLAEAMACGVVPLVPALGDLTSVVEDGRNGLLYEAAELGTLVDRIETLHREPALRARLSRGALATAAELSWERIASFVLETSAVRSEG